MNNNGWISVKDKLPEHGVYVLIFAEWKSDYNFEDTIIDITCIVNQKLFHDSPDNYVWIPPFQYFSSNYEITYWMPLPKPPERESIPVWWLKKRMVEVSRENETGDAIAEVLDLWEIRDVYKD